MDARGPSDKDMNKYQDELLFQRGQLEALLERATRQKSMCDQLKQENISLRGYVENILASENNMGSR
ncbi:AGR097W-Ap [Eremothecium gossypii ATCC 10895]|uniref:AGR097W-Ap n=1 Tax=Eremothecium gossypii (strain ATCC 10895 / CBS 109.51 / FGSC 9923 / NRRL Y-1056) TaxID=284811 RepID=Q74ZV1_EREGS|nr:AGR097W-Ap [Eremothecium gossypii ATCC 10895]AAS54587.1 AGR097W-Ap [Eremothecium gossypii ATCC 10895]AEY98918.1 FAGR097W-Ap [Eremothecium gossypii FDAG1]